MSSQTTAGVDVVMTRAEASLLQQEPLLIIEPLLEFLDEVGLGSGPLTATPIGEGHSNITYALDRADCRVVMRRPPRGPLPASTHDMLREARLIRALGAAGVRVPKILAVCETSGVIGAPFYLMDFIEGHVVGREMPLELAGARAAAQISEQLLDTLVEVHGVDITKPDVASFGRPVGYLERQIKVFSNLLERSGTRPLPDLEIVAGWLATNRPVHSENSVVHGDFRLGNVMLAGGAPPLVIAVLDWEMATLGDPLADLGYLTATWAEADDPPDPMLELSQVTRGKGFPGRDQLAASYADRTGRDISSLEWYQTLALFKAAIFLEGSYQRYLAGTTDDRYFARLEHGVPNLAARALRIAARA